jgi:hypothetical protein
MSFLLNYVGYNPYDDLGPKEYYDFCEEKGLKPYSQEAWDEWTKPDPEDYHDYDEMDHYLSDYPEADVPIEQWRKEKEVKKQQWALEQKADDLWWKNQLKSDDDELPF